MPPAAPKVPRVPGHELRQDGHPYRWSKGKWITWQSDRMGHALCYCGDASPLLPSREARIRWHKQHKLRILEGREPEWTPERIEQALSAELIATKVRKDARQGRILVTLPWDDLVRLVQELVDEHSEWDTPDALTRRLELWERLGTTSLALRDSTSGGRV